MDINSFRIDSSCIDSFRGEAAAKTVKTAKAGQTPGAGDQACASLGQAQPGVAAPPASRRVLAGTNALTDCLRDLCACPAGTAAGSEGIFSAAVPQPAPDESPGALEPGHLAGRMALPAIGQLTDAPRAELFAGLARRIDTATAAGQALDYQAVHDWMNAAAGSLDPPAAGEVQAGAAALMSSVARNFCRSPEDMAAFRAFTHAGGALEMLRHVCRLAPGDQMPVLAKLSLLFTSLDMQSPAAEFLTQLDRRWPKPHGSRSNRQLSLARSVSSLQSLVHNQLARNIASFICRLHGTQLPPGLKASTSRAAWLQYILSVFKGDGITHPYVSRCDGPIHADVQSAGVRVLEALLHEHISRRAGDPDRGRVLNLTISSAGHPGDAGRSPLCDTIGHVAKAAPGWHAAFSPADHRVVQFAPVGIALAGASLVA